jgi:hypothetical protein
MAYVMSNRVSVVASAMTRALILAILLCSGPISAANLDSTFVAMVVESSGPANAGLSPHKELPAGTRISLDAGSRLVLLHYASCSLVTVSSGSIVVTSQGINVETAHVDSKKPGPCPRIHRLVLAGRSALGGAIIARGIPRPPLVLAPGSTVVIAGDTAGGAVSADIADADRHLVLESVPIRDSAFKLNKSLVLPQRVVLRISFNEGRGPFEVPMSVSDTSPDSLLILRLE